MAARITLRDVVENDDQIERYPDAEDSVGRALLAGARAPLRYLGTGATAHVYRDAQGLAFKVGRSSLAMTDAGPRRFVPDFLRRSLGEEAAWLRSAGRGRATRDMVPRLHRWDEANAVIVRDHVPGVLAFGRHPKSGDYMDQLAQKKFEALEAAMLRKGWTAPEGKPESWAFDEEDPTKARIFDAGMAHMVGRRLVAHALGLAKRGASREDLDDTMRAIRNEATHWKSPTISMAVGRRTLDALERAGGSPDLARGMVGEVGRTGRKENPRGSHFPIGPFWDRLFKRLHGQGKILLYRHDNGVDERVTWDVLLQDVNFWTKDADPKNFRVVARNPGDEDDVPDPRYHLPPISRAAEDLLRMLLRQGPGPTGMTPLSRKEKDFLRLFNEGRATEQQARLMDELTARRLAGVRKYRGASRYEAADDAHQYLSWVAFRERAPNPRPERPGRWVQRIAAQARLSRMRSKRSAFEGADLSRVKAIELESVRDPRRVFIVAPGVRGDDEWKGVRYPWQISRFHRREDGEIEPMGHSNARTLQEAIEKLAREEGEVRRTRLANPSGLRIVSHEVPVWQPGGVPTIMVYALTDEPHDALDPISDEPPALRERYWKEKAGMLLVEEHPSMGLATVGWIQVSPNMQRRGIATKLYHEAARVAGAKGLRLASDVSLESGARGFWEKQVAKGRAEKRDVKGGLHRFELRERSPRTLENPPGGPYVVFPGIPITVQKLGYSRSPWRVLAHGREIEFLHWNTKKEAMDFANASGILSLPWSIPTAEWSEDSRRRLAEIQRTAPGFASWAAAVGRSVEQGRAHLPPLPARSAPLSAPPRPLWAAGPRALPEPTPLYEMADPSAATFQAHRAEKLRGIVDTKPEHRLPSGLMVSDLGMRMVPERAKPFLPPGVVAYQVVDAHQGYHAAESELLRQGFGATRGWHYDVLREPRGFHDAEGHLVTRWLRLFTREKILDERGRPRGYRLIPWRGDGPASVNRDHRVLAAHVEELRREAEEERRDVRRLGT